MSSLSAQGYSLAQIVDKSTTAFATQATTASVTILPAYDLPEGVWMVELNNLVLTGAITDTNVILLVEGSAVASFQVPSDVTKVPTLMHVINNTITAGASNATLTATVQCSTSAGTWDVSVGKLRCTRLAQHPTGVNA